MGEVCMNKNILTSREKIIFSLLVNNKSTKEISEIIKRKNEQKVYIKQVNYII